MKLYLSLFCITLSFQFAIAQSNSDCEEFRAGKFKYKDAVIIKTSKKQIEKDIGVGKIYFDVVNFGSCESYLIYNDRKTTLNGDLNKGDTVYCMLLEVRKDTFLTKQSYNDVEYLREYIKIKN